MRLRQSLSTRRLFLVSSLAVAGVLPLAQAHAGDLAKIHAVRKKPSGADLFTFTRFRVTSVDGRRFYRVTVAEPHQPAPADGYPVVYMLDGNSVVDALPHQDLSRVAHEGMPVLVAIGDDPEMPENLAARPYDYLPPTSTTEPTYETDKNETLAGGADIFLDLLEKNIRPLVESRFRIDRRRQTLWGHSYGGLFALHVLFTRPKDFQSYIAVSPSIRWHESFVLQEEAAYIAKPQDPARLFLMVGGEEQRAHVVNPPVPGSSNPHETVHTSNQSAMAERLSRLPAMSVQFREFPATSHGPMLPASLRPALEWAVEGNNPSL